MRRLIWPLVMAILVTGAALGVGGAISLVAAAQPNSTATSLVHIPKGATTASIGKLLAGKKIVKNALAFRLAARLDHLGGSLQAGWYKLGPGMTTDAILQTLVKGDVATFRFTVPEGYTVDQIRGVLLKAKLGTADEVDAALSERKWVARWVPADAKVKQPLEGYLFPETYTMHYGDSADAAVQAMVARFASEWTPAMQAQAQKLDLSVNQVVTLASIIELETKYADDRPLASAVFHNRLKRGMPLGSDVTVAYALGKPASQLTLDDLKVDLPYNTYVHTGLPPGPICSPGLASIDAALHPADVDYLYFVAEPDGHLLFAKTQAQHLRNVRKVRSMSQH